MHYWVDLQSVHGLRCYGNITRTITVSEYMLVLALCLVFGRPFVKRFALCYRSVVCLSVCLSCLSVTFVHGGQTVGRIKMKLGVQVGLGPGHIVLDGDPVPLPNVA